MNGIVGMGKIHRGPRGSPFADVHEAPIGQNRVVVILIISPIPRCQWTKRMSRARLYGVQVSNRTRKTMLCMHAV
jgi:hypothetical protein